LRKHVHAGGKRSVKGPVLEVQAYMGGKISLGSQVRKSSMPMRVGTVPFKPYITDITAGWFIV
jgi:hypothetical protein